MPDSPDLAELRLKQRRSLNAIPGHAIFVALVGIALGTAYVWYPVPTWLTGVVVLFSLWGLVGDVVNVVVLGRRIKKAEHT